MQDVFDMNVNAGNVLSLDERIKMLNSDQRHVFCRVKDHLLDQKWHQCQQDDMYLSPNLLVVWKARENFS